MVIFLWQSKLLSSRVQLEGQQRARGADRGAEVPGARGLALLPSPLPRKALLLPSRVGSPVPPPAP